MLSPLERMHTRSVIHNLAKTVTDDLDLDTALRLWPHCEDVMMDVCCLRDEEVIHDTANRVQIVCNRIIAAHAYHKVGDIIADKARALAADCAQVKVEMMEWITRS